jgi:hypothetical protein
VAQVVLGVDVEGGRPATPAGLQQHGGWVTLDESLLNQHLLVVGTTGAGKSETLKWLIQETLRAGGRDVFFVDGKGDLQLGQEIAQLIHAHHRQAVPLFSLGTGYRGAVYHGFCGEPIDIYNRLVSLVGVEGAQGGASFYADVNRDLLQLVCYAPGGPPRSFEALRARLNPQWLATAYQSRPEEQAALAGLDPAWLAGAAVRLRPLLRDLAPHVGEEGFRLETSRGAVFALRTSSLPDTARRFLDFLMEDLKDFVGKRQRRPGLLVIDEFGAFQNDKIVALLTMARSAELGVVLATQDVANLGQDEQTRRLILANTRTKLLLASDYPEEVAQLAGTLYQIEASLQHAEGLATGMGSARVQHAFRINMNEAAQLLPGEAFVIRQRHAVKVKIKAAAKLPGSPATLAQFEKHAPSPVLPTPHAAHGDLPDLPLP